MKFTEFLEVLNGLAAFWIMLTVVGYQIGVWIFRLANANPLAQPIVLAVAVVIAALAVMGHSYQIYFRQVQLIHVLAGPATVALAVPLYLQLPLVKRLFLPLLVSLAACGVFTVASTVLIAKAMGASEVMLLSLATKSITTPIALGVSEVIGGYPSVAAGMVIVTGVISAIIGLPLLQRMGVAHPAAQGLALGFSGHAIGTARALQHSPQAGGFAALGMGLMGIATAIVLPVTIHFLI